VEARELQISPEPSQYSNGGTFVVNLSELLSHDSFYNIDALHVQLEIGAPSWAFQRQDTTRNTRNYFVGLTSDGNARISLLRRNAKIDLNTGSHVTGVIQDMTRGFWYEIKPNVKGTSVVTTILDREIAPFADPIVPKIHQEKMKQTKQTNNAQQKKQQLPQEENFEGFPAPAPGKAQPIEHRKQLFRDQQSTSSWLQSARKLVNSWILPWGRISASPWNDVGEDTVVDIMVVWTKSAECIKSYLSANCTVSTQTRQNMKLSILFFLQETNMAFANSGINLRLNLIHEQRVLYEETTFVQAVLDMKDGQIPMLHEQRERHGADMVMLLMDQTHDYPETGIAYNNYDHVDSADYMYSVVATQYTSVWFLPAHELAHNFGCSHDRGTLGMCQDDAQSNYGYRDPQGRFRTIMSYPCEARSCNHNSQHPIDKKNHCSLIPYFSNEKPDISYNGSTLGGPANNCAGQIERVMHQVDNLY